MTRIGRLAGAFALLLSLLAAGGVPHGTRSLAGVRAANGSTAPSTAGEGPRAATPGTRPAAFSSCRSADPEHLCLSVHYVGYVDSSGGTTVDAVTAERNIETMNSIWRHCNIGFQVDEFTLVKPGERNLVYRPSGFPEFDRIRSAFERPDKLLVVTTGPWDRCCGMTANAWTTMPGEAGPFGVVVERPVGDFGNIVAHEMGHYLGLSHFSSRGNVMNATIYNASTGLDGDQCTSARAAVSRFWSTAARWEPGAPSPAWPARRAASTTAEFLSVVNL